MSCKVSNPKNIHLLGIKAVVLHLENSLAAQELEEEEQSWETIEPQVPTFFTGP